MARSCCYEALRLSAYGFRDVAVLRDVLQVFGEQARQYAYSRRDWRARVAREVVNYRIGARPRAIQSDDAKNFVRHSSH